MIRRAVEGDIGEIDVLLYQVHALHAEGRPDFFKPGKKKYSDEELAALIKEDDRPIYVWTDEEDVVRGYAFCIKEESPEDDSRYGRRTLYIDDLCVDQGGRGKGIGKALCDYVKRVAAEEDFDAVTLHVWEVNPKARKFYETMGFTPLKTMMEMTVEKEGS